MTDGGGDVEGKVGWVPAAGEPTMARTPPGRRRPTARLRAAAVSMWWNEATMAMRSQLAGSTGKVRKSPRR